MRLGESFFIWRGQYLDAGLIVPHRPRLIPRSNGYVKTFLGNVDPNPYLTHKAPHSLMSTGYSRLPDTGS